MNLQSIVSLVCLSFVLLYVSLMSFEAVELYQVRKQEQLYSLQQQAQFESMRDCGPVTVESKTYVQQKYSVMRLPNNTINNTHAVMLLPGLIRNAKSFEYFAYMIACAGYVVVIPPESMLRQQLEMPYGVDKIAIDVLQFAKNIGIVKYTLVGHSYGALIGLRMCLIAQRDIKQLIAVSPYIGLSINPFSALANYLARLPSTLYSILHSAEKPLSCQTEAPDDYNTVDYIKRNIQLIMRAQEDTIDRSLHIQTHVDFVVSKHDHITDNNLTIQLALAMQHSTIQTVASSHFIAKSPESVNIVLQLIKSSLKSA